MNKRLDGLEPESAETEADWVVYVRQWIKLNNSRSLGAILTAGLWTIPAVTLITSGQV